MKGEHSRLDRNDILLRRVNKSQIQGLLNRLDVSDSRNFTHDIFAREERLDLGAFVSGSIVAYGFLKFNKQSFRRDLCNLGLVVHQNYRHRGVGTVFVRKLIEEARKRQIRKVWINVYSDNTEGVAFWIKRGFQIEGFLKDNENWNGTFRSMFQMCMFLPDIV